MQGEPTATTAAFNLMDYAEPTAFVAVLGLFIWGITKAIPLLLDKREKQLAEALVREDKIREAHMTADKEAREAFLAELRYHHEEFTKNVGDARRMFAEELQAHRTQSKTLANEGHKAVEKLASSFNDLEHTFREMMDKLAERTAA